MSGPAVCNCGRASNEGEFLCPTPQKERGSHASDRLPQMRCRFGNPGAFTTPSFRCPLCKTILRLPGSLSTRPKVATTNTPSPTESPTPHKLQPEKASSLSGSLGSPHSLKTPDQIQVAPFSAWLRHYSERVKTFMHRQKPLTLPSAEDVSCSFSRTTSELSCDAGITPLVRRRTGLNQTVVADNGNATMTACRDCLRR